ncbi:hypothetical protein ACFQH9_24520 [Pseudonocardia lutea]|uniref:MarR family transcriptional regulator n=1 Tax=Pseudonocardia lutea TaxID=2172015 RepID=A0ABW1IGM5_9PSEU
MGRRTRELHGTTDIRTSDRAREHRALLERAWARTVAGALGALSAEEAAAVRAAVPGLMRLAEALSLGERGT